MSLGPIGQPPAAIDRMDRLDPPDVDFVGVCCGGGGCPYGAGAHFPPEDVPVDGEGRPFKFVDGEWYCWRCVDDLEEDRRRAEVAAAAPLLWDGDQA